MQTAVTVQRFAICTTSVDFKIIDKKGQITVQVLLSFSIHFSVTIMHISTGKLIIPKKLLYFNLGFLNRVLHCSPLYLNTNSTVFIAHFQLPLPARFIASCRALFSEGERNEVHNN